MDFVTMNRQFENSALYRESRQLEEAEDEEEERMYTQDEREEAEQCAREEAEDREFEEEINYARELTIKDYKKDYGYGRYNVRGGGESIYEGNSLNEAINSLTDHFASLPGVRA